MPISRFTSTMKAAHLHENPENPCWLEKRWAFLLNKGDCSETTQSRWVETKDLQTMREKMGQRKISGNHDTRFSSSFKRKQEADERQTQNTIRENSPWTADRFEARGRRGPWLPDKTNAKSYIFLWYVFTSEIKKTTFWLNSERIIKRLSTKDEVFILY